jgi:biopolymer transport protein ExbD
MDDKPFETMNVVPFIDIMLVLLVMVLTTANFVVTGRIPVSLPQTAAAQIEKKQDRTIEIDSNGELALDGERLRKEDLAGKLAGLTAETSFLIRADKTVALQTFVDIADILKQGKFKKVSIQTKSLSRATESGESRAAP